MPTALSKTNWQRISVVSCIGKRGCDQKLIVEVERWEPYSACELRMNLKWLEAELAKSCVHIFTVGYFVK